MYTFKKIAVLAIDGFVHAAGALLPSYTLSPVSVLENKHGE